MESLIGSIEKGKRADVIMIRLDQPHAVPIYNVYSQLVYALKASDVADVMVNGRVDRARQENDDHRSWSGDGKGRGVSGASEEIFGAVSPVSTYNLKISWCCK